MKSGRADWDAPLLSAHWVTWAIYLTQLSPSCLIDRMRIMGGPSEASESLRSSVSSSLLSTYYVQSPEQSYEQELPTRLKETQTVPALEFTVQRSLRDSGPHLPSLAFWGPRLCLQIPSPAFDSPIASLWCPAGERVCGVSQGPTAPNPEALGCVGPEQC